MHECPQIILEQLGGRRFIAMTGAKDFIGAEDSLTFRLPGTPGFVKDGIDRVRITLEPSDTYTVHCFRARTRHLGPRATASNIYADMLQETFTRLTGLDTHL
jgi:hypothetical protein